MPATRAYSSDAFNSLPFRDKLEVLYGVSAVDKRDLILSSPEAQRLVRSFAPESLFYTVKEIGLADAADLIALASGEQISALVDLDCWRKDRLDTSSLLDWLELVVEGGTRPLGEFLNTVDLQLLVVLMKRFIRVWRTDDPEEPPELEEGHEIFELDEHYRIEFIRRDARAPLVRQLLEGLYERDYSYFVTVMEEVWWGVESDLEEASFQVRNARLQDRGFPDYFEAQEIFRPLATLPDRAAPLGRENGSRTADGEVGTPLDRTLLVLGEARSFFSEVMNAGFDFDSANELRQEMAYLTNRVMVAEGVDFADRDAVHQAVRLAHDTVNLALDRLSGGDFEKAVVVLQRRYLQHLFRFAWSLLLELRRRAKSAVEALGLASRNGVVDFLDGPYREAVAGLLRMKPRFYDGVDRPGEITYRPLASTADLEKAEALLGDVAAIPVLCQRLVGQRLGEVAKLRPGDADDFRVSAVLLTAFANAALGRTESLEPLSADDVVRLREIVNDPATSKVRPDLRERFLEAAGPGAGFLGFCLDRLEDELLAVSGEVDPRFVTCLLLLPRT